MHLGGYNGFYMMWDPTYILILVGVVLSMLASARVKSTFSWFSRVRSMSGLTGAQTAQRILDYAGIRDVRIVPISGSLTDHYDPGKKQVALSESVYGQNSVAAIAVAAHECGHVLQHANHYAPLSIRSALVPVANFGSGASWFFILGGILFSFQPLITAGIILFSAAVLFQIVTLPVEFNASRRALGILQGESLRDSVIREIREETGLVIKNPQPCGFKDWILEDGTRYIVLLYKTDQFEGELKNSREGKVFWLDRNDISSANLIWNMRELLEIFETDQYSEFFFQAGKENVGWHNLLG